MLMKKLIIPIVVLVLMSSVVTALTVSDFECVGGSDGSDQGEACTPSNSCRIRACDSRDVTCLLDSTPSGNVNIDCNSINKIECSDSNCFCPSICGDGVKNTFLGEACDPGPCTTPFSCQGDPKASCPFDLLCELPGGPNPCQCVVTPIPEFSTAGILAALVAIGLGTAFVVRRKKK